MVLIIKAVTSEANNITVKKYAYGVTLSMVNGLIKRNETKIAENVRVTSLRYVWL